MSEGQGIRLAHLFDLLLAVHTSMVGPLPHQISAVYEAMLPRQPLRFLLADDSGAGKTIMVGTLLIPEDATTTDGTAAPERNERGAIATAEDPTTTDGTTAPERNERSAIATAEDARTTDGTAAPERNERGAISAAEFLGGQRRSELARYQEVREDLVRVTGRPLEVSNLDADTAWIGGDNIEGLEHDELLTATHQEPGAGD